MCVQCCYHILVLLYVFSTMGKTVCLGHRNSYIVVVFFTDENFLLQACLFRIQIYYRKTYLYQIIVRGKNNKTVYYSVVMVVFNSIKV